MLSKDESLRFMSWAEFDGLTAILSRKLLDSDVKPDLIVAIARGGLVPAAVLAHHFGCRAFGVLNILRTTSDRPFSLPPSGIHLELVGLPENNQLVETILLVDDIVGHGLTLSLAKSLLRERYPGKTIVLAALVDDLNLPLDSSARTITPYFAASEMSDADWVVFPWETTPQPKVLGE